VDPARVAGRRAEVERFLPPGAGETPELVGEQPSEPWNAREDERLSRHLRALGQREAVPAAPDRARDGPPAGLPTLRPKRFDDVLAGASGQGVAGLWLPESAPDVLHRNVRISAPDVLDVDPLNGQAFGTHRLHRCLAERRVVAEHPQRANAVEEAASAAF